MVRRALILLAGLISAIVMAKGVVVCDRASSSYNPRFYLCSWQRGPGVLWLMRQLRD
jgi:hypothetical protein